MRISYDPGLVADLLQPGEGFELIVMGRVVEAPKPAIFDWMIVVTSRRLLCVKGNRVPRKRVIEVPKENITSVMHYKGFFESECRVTTTMGTVSIFLQKSAATLLHHTLLNGPVPQMAHTVTVHGTPGKLAAPMMSPAAPLPPRAAAAAQTPTHSQEQIDQLVSTVERLETDLQQLQAQVEFLENLLTKRATA